MEPTAIEGIGGLATTAFDSVGPQVLAVGGAGILLLASFVVYRMVTTAVRSKGKSVG